MNGVQEVSKVGVTVQMRDQSMITTEESAGQHTVSSSQASHSANTKTDQIASAKC